MNRPLVLVAMAALVMGASRDCVAQDFAGLSIGQVLELPQCDWRQNAYLPDDHTTCFKLVSGPVDPAHVPANGQVIVNIALPDRPDFMDGSDAVAQLRDARLVSLSVRSHGPARDSRDFAALQDRFGTTSPRYLSTTEPVQTYRSLRADWSLPDGSTVYFNSAEFGDYYGLVRIQSQAAPAHQPGAWD